MEFSQIAASHDLAAEPVLRSLSQRPVRDEVNAPCLIRAISRESFFAMLDARRFRWGRMMSVPLARLAASQTQVRFRQLLHVVNPDHFDAIAFCLPAIERLFTDSGLVD